MIQSTIDHSRMALPKEAREYILPQTGAINNLTVRTKEITEPRGSDVLVKIHAVSLNYLDVTVALGQYTHPIPPNFVPVSDMAGEVVAVGPDVIDWKLGDRVAANFGLDHVYGDLTPAIEKSFMGTRNQGVLTEYRTFPAHSLVAIPEHLSYEEGSTLPCTGVTAYNALFGNKPLRAGETVLVQGTGGVSIFALRFAVASGATVIATSSSDEKLKLAASLGAKHLINYKKTPNWDEEAIRLTNGRGVDHIVEVGGAGTFGKSVNAARIGGQIHMIGFVSSDKQDTNATYKLIVKCLIVRGVMIGSVVQFKEMNRLLSANPDNTRPIIDKVFDFEDAKAAYEYLQSQAHVGKVVIKVAKE